MGIDEKPVQELQREDLVYLGGVVSISLEMVLYDGFQHIPLKVWAGEATRVKQYFAEIARQGVPIPGAEMAELVPAQKQAFKVEWRKRMIDASQPLGHAIVKGILGPEGEFLKAASDRCRPLARSAT